MRTLKTLALLALLVAGPALAADIPPILRVEPVPLTSAEFRTQAGCLKAISDEVVFSSHWRELAVGLLARYAPCDALRLVQLARQQ